MVVPLPGRIVRPLVYRAQLFGKMPSHGDFVGRGINGHERDNLDGWLSLSMLQAREHIGAAFEDRYDRAPPWRFAVSDAAGVVVPSMDAVGRRYPLYLALADAPPAMAEACEELVYNAFAQGWDVDRLEAEANALAMAPGKPSMDDRWWTVGGEGFPPAEYAGYRPHGLFAAMLMSEEQA